MGFPGGSDSKESACNEGDLGSIPGWGKSPGERNGYSLQYSCLGNSMDRGVWRATVNGVAKSQICVLVAQLCPTLCDPMDYTVHGISQARILE